MVLVQGPARIKQSSPESYALAKSRQQSHPKGDVLGKLCLGHVSELVDSHRPRCALAVVGVDLGELGVEDGLGRSATLLAELKHEMIVCVCGATGQAFLHE